MKRFQPPAMSFMTLATMLACGLGCSKPPEQVAPASSLPSTSSAQEPTPSPSPPPAPVQGSAAPAPVGSTEPAPLPVQPDVQFSAGSAADEAMMKEAFGEVSGTLNDPTFRQELEELGNHPLATTPDRDCEVTTPLAVLDSLRRLPPKFVIKTKSMGGLGLTGACGPLQIKTGWLEDWRKDNPKIKAGIVDTFAHEMVHVLTTASTTCSNHPRDLYTDREHVACANGKTCSDAFLVSYTWGDIVECAYRVKKGMEANFKSCVLKTVNDSPLDRSSMSFRIPTHSKCADTPPDAWRWH